MSAECVEGLLVWFAVAYWAASSAVLLLRLVWPDFQALAAYGGHGSNGNSTIAPAARGSRHDASVNSSTKVVLLGRAKKSVSSCCSLPMRLVHASPLGARRVTRQQAFTAFYGSGVGMCVLECALAAAHRWHGGTANASHARQSQRWWLTMIPLLLFTVHCTVRLYETRRVQRFRPHDSVTVFAALAGSTFYLCAAVSSAVPAHVHYPFASRWLHHSTDLQALFLLGVLAYVTVQLVQVMVHTILAGLRPAAAAAAAVEAAKRTEAQSIADEVREEGLWRYVLAHKDASDGGCVAKTSHVPSASHGAWRSYHFPHPSNPVFQLVLDPHYTCEVLLYMINTVLIGLCVLPDPKQPINWAAGWGTPEGHATAPAPSWLRVWGSACACAAWLSVIASAAVTLFTLVNLSITAAEHRRFWNASNATRREVAAILGALLRAEGPAERQLPAELVGVATRMLERDLVEEVLPRWNVIPLIC